MSDNQTENVNGAGNASVPTDTPGDLETQRDFGRGWEIERKLAKDLEDVLTKLWRPTGKKRTLLRAEDNLCDEFTVFYNKFKIAVGKLGLEMDEGMDRWQNKILVSVLGATIAGECGPKWQSHEDSVFKQCQTPNDFIEAFVQYRYLDPQDIAGKYYEFLHATLEETPEAYEEAAIELQNFQSQFVFWKDLGDSLHAKGTHMDWPAFSLYVRLLLGKWYKSGPLSEDDHHAVLSQLFTEVAKERLRISGPTEPVGLQAVLYGQKRSADLNDAGAKKAKFGLARTKNSGCFVCGSKDHFKRDCPKRKAGDKAGKDGSKNH